MAAKHITEVLKELNDNLDLFNTTYKKTGENSVLELLFKHAFLPEYKFILPPASPPFKPNTSPLGLSPAIFIQEIRKFNLFMRTDINNFKREMLFIQLLENIHPDEAKILLAIKEQTLTKLYKNLTYDNIAKAGYLPVRETPKVSTKPAPKPRTPKAAKVVSENTPEVENINTIEI
jgi:hypothetical protein